ncbi:hypothetical protein GXM_03185 [Nostoc sphaeroides CCNUC1]|uniref:Uncharacterized protein n=1 Tax=Nostoc sphaeroides CCNUC1 TaxID=2653204 RepID=A0A5P8VZ53_9NOSO|nr:hypothetical protein GXM_03185 [Nostoc sphaeroides CCNUC1]
MLFYWAAAASLEAPPQGRAFPASGWERGNLSKLCFRSEFNSVRG